MNLKYTIIALAALLAAPAIASDLQPVKARVAVAPRVVSFNPNPTGWYLGLGASASVASTEFNGTFPAGTFGAGAGADVLFGYILSADPATGEFKALESGFTWRTASATAACDPMGPCDAQSKYGLWQGIKLGGSLTALTAAFPGGGNAFPGLATAPAVSPTTHPYLWLSVHEDFVRSEIGGVSASRINFAPYVGVGVLQQLTPSQVSDTRLECTPPSSSMTVGFGAVKAGWACMARQAIEF